MFFQSERKAKPQWPGNKLPGGKKRQADFPLSPDLLWLVGVKKENRDKAEVETETEWQTVQFESQRVIV